MLAALQATFESKLDWAEIKYVDIRRADGQVAVTIVMNNAKDTIQFTFQSYEIGLKFCSEVWERRHHALEMRAAG